MTIFVKLRLNSGRHLIMDKFFKTRRCPLFRGFTVSLYKELLEPTFPPFPIVLDNLHEVFGCYVITDFIPTMFAFLKVFG